MSTRPDFARCVTKHPDGRWLYYLPGADDYGITAVLAEHPQPDGTTTGHPMDRVGKGKWWSTTTKAARIVLLKQPNRLTTGHVLKDPETASVRFPAELTVEEWRRRIDQGTNAECDTLWALYESVTEPQDPIEVPVDGPFVVLEGGEPPAADAPQWTVNLTDAITQRPEYAHLFPGYINGLREHVHKLIDRMPNIRFNFNGYQGQPGLHVTLKVPFEQPVTRWQADRSRRTDKPLKTGRNVPVTVDRRLLLPVPTRVSGNTYAEALAEWNTQVTYWTDQVEAASVAACNRCHGTGHVPEGAEQYDATR
jgi:hypothetical protein